MARKSDLGTRVLRFRPPGHMGRVDCIVCNQSMRETDAFPALVDGTGEGACPHCKAAHWREAGAINGRDSITVGLVAS